MDEKFSRKNVMIILVLLLIIDWATPFIPLGSVILLLCVGFRSKTFINFIQNGFEK